MTYKDMCEKIVEANFLRKQDNTAPTAEEIFNYSPTGELYMIPLWYQAALHITDGVSRQILMKFCEDDTIPQ